jgi:hypothetical protein
MAGNSATRIANRLAETALENIPYSRIEDALVCGSERLLRSFSRRLGYLGASKEAAAIVTRWLGPDRILREFSRLNELGRTVLQNVAPVAPLAVLEGLERWAHRSDEVGMLAGSTHLIRLIRSIAYDAEPLLVPASRTKREAVSLVRYVES